MISDPAVELLPPNLVCHEPIYHYTTAAGLLGIINYHTLWATEAFGLNDVSELRHGWDFVQEWLGDQPVDDAIEEMARFAEQDYGAPDVEVFMCCASTLSDDASQWRLYADNSKGYAVELDPNIGLAVASRRDVSPAPNYEPKQLGMILRDHAQVSPWLHVMYTEQQKVEALTAYHASVVRLIGEQEAIETSTYEDYQIQRQERQAIVKAGLATLAQCMKAEAFRSEAEVRAVATLSFDIHAGFRGTPYGIVRYVELMTNAGEEPSTRVSFGQKTMLPVRSVRLGPGQVAQNSRAAIRSALDRYDYEKTLIRVSSAKLR